MKGNVPSADPASGRGLTRRSARILRLLLPACFAALTLAAAAAPASAYIYWGTFTGLGINNTTGPISRANLNGTGLIRRFISGAENASGVAVDAAHVYWTSIDGTIGRANLDGTAVDQRFIPGPSTADGVAVDPAHIYWSNQDGSIGRANLDGTGIDQHFITGIQATDGIAVDGAHIYWSNQGGTIGRANLDGTGIDQSFVSGATDPGDVAVDSGHIYWTNGTQNSIDTGVGRANLDGTGVTNRFIDVAPLGGVAVDGTHIYWSNNDGTIGRANLDGTGVDQRFIAGVQANGGIAVDSLGPTGGTQPPPPVFGKTANVVPVSGRVLVRLPGSREFVSLSSARTLPLGSLVDTTGGKVRLTSARSSTGGTESGVFYSGVFRVTQTRARSGVRSGQLVGLTVLTLAGPRPSGCASARGRAGIAKKRPRKRQLWGHAKGNFRTVGGSASATVRGTEWLTEDTCAGTLIRVVHGVISVDDFVHHRTFLLHAGHSYVARRNGRKPRATESPALWAALGGKTICGLAVGRGQQLLCSARVVPAPKQGRREGDPGFVFLRATGPPQLARLSQYSWQKPSYEPTGTPTLAIGQTWSRAGLGVKCTVTTDTVRCANRSNYGFAITLSTYRQF